MELRNHNTYKNILSLFLTGIMFLLILNNAFFLHSHQTKDGNILQHAHPYHKAETPYKSQETHTHSDLALILSFNLSSFIFFLSVFILFQAFSLIRKIKVYIFQWFHNNSLAPLNSRAPPFFLSQSF